MDMHYCDIFGDCYHCPAGFCPYEKYETDWQDDAGPAEDGDPGEAPGPEEEE